MKIDPGSLANDPARVTPAKSSAAQGPQRQGGTPARSSDAVQVSSDAQLAAEAARQIGEVGGDEIRPDAVERAKAAVARGEVGADLERLADRLIDRLVDE
jgi:flagellar biosynthesis anti-sigma factor FlgM